MRKKAPKKPRPWRGAALLRKYTDNVIMAAAPAWRRSLRAFAVWLEEDRCLELSSITLRVAQVR